MAFVLEIMTLYTTFGLGFYVLDKPCWNDFKNLIEVCICNEDCNCQFGWQISQKWSFGYLSTTTMKYSKYNFCSET